MQEEIEKTLKALRAGGTILYPTDTIWGIGCDATNQKAVDRIYQIKRRIEDKSLLVLVDSRERILQYVEKVNPLIFDLVSNYDKPLTVIYENAKNVAKGVAAQDNTIGIRIVQDEFCRELIRQFGKAIVSTSANISGSPAALWFQQISPEIKKSVDYVVNLHQHEIRKMKPSRIIKAKSNGDFEIIRD
ncbi:MAG TPA: L-threonylcarbamoyladenylate synthase [Bacteroidales bacterium]|nr:L-threonylcarbamoyladenylate synthase [Bacteroidales bacterium]HPR59210.1 L-threonylcarbamoyladenylate synthase [Bacteroidales bacterium]HRW97163.1 L-threonylcarbamoyladenylate synthase [Bacteroidales bacterium]